MIVLHMYIVVIFDIILVGLLQINAFTCLCGVSLFQSKQLLFDKPYNCHGDMNFISVIPSPFC